jgi:hypothetical protein
MLALIVLVIGIAVWFAFMGLTLALPIRPDVVRLTERWVCPPGVKLHVETHVYPYHRIGERVISIYYWGDDGIKHQVKVQALVILWGLFFVVALVLTVVIGGLMVSM